MTRASTGTAPLTIAVTAVGAIIGQGIVKSLRQAGWDVRVIGVDRNAQGLGPYWCDAFFAKPEADEDSRAYTDFWIDLISSEKIDMVMPGLESDVLFFDRNRDAMADLGVAVVLNDSRLIHLAEDKWLFGEELVRLGLPAIPATLSQDWHEIGERLGDPPFLLKPRCGNGSRGIVRIGDEHDFAYWSRKSAEGVMIQKFIGDDEAEFTVGTFGFGDGTSLAPIIFRRKLAVAGNTQYAEVVDDSVVAAASQALTERFRPLGPTNYQFRVENGIAYTLEINPRFSSSTSLRAAFGFNEAAMAVEFFLFGRRPSAPVIRGGRAWRYAEDHIAT